MGKRFAILISVAAAGVMALGTQTAAAAPEVVKYDTELTISKERMSYYSGEVTSEVRECMEGRRVVLFELRPGADLKLGTDRSQFRPVGGGGFWEVMVHRAKRRAYAKVRREVRDEFVCRADRSANIGGSAPPQPAGTRQPHEALAGQTVKIDSKVTLRHRCAYRIHPSGGCDFRRWNGRVRSSRHACEDNRKVRLFKQYRNRPDKLLWKGTAGARGRWKFDQGPPQPGLYYAKTPRQKKGTAGTGFICRADRSKVHDVH